MNYPQTDLLPRGPAAGAGWEERQLETCSGGSTTILVTPDDANAARINAGERPVYYYVLQTPQVAHTGGGLPAFTLTLLLDRQPEPNETAVQALIRQGILGLDVTLLAEAGALCRLAQRTGAEYRPLFATQAEFRLEAATKGDGYALGHATGSVTRAALTANLTQEHALAVMAALRGLGDDVRLVSGLTYRTAGAAATAVRVEADWARVHDFLAARGGDITRDELRAALVDMVAAGVVTLETTAHPITPAVYDAVFPVFLRLAAIILQPTGAGAYRLRSRPANGTHMGADQVIEATAGEGQVTLAAALAAVLDGLLDGREIQDYVHLKALGEQSLLEDVPTRVITGPSRDAPAADRGRVQMAKLGSQTVSLTQALRPHTLKWDAPLVPAANLALYAQIYDHPGVHQWTIDDMVLSPDIVAQPLQSGPQIDDARALLWPDRWRSERYWYAPSFRLVLPATNATPDGAPFSFRFVTVGHSASGLAGLEATLLVTLEQEMSPEVQRAWDNLGQPSLTPVPVSGVAVVLEVPFRDEQGQNRTERFAADTVEKRGSQIVASFRLLDAWARLCYGALAFVGFQSQPVHLSVSYTFAAYVPVPVNKLELLYGGKLVETPVYVHPLQPHPGPDPDWTIRWAEQPYIDANQLALVMPNGKLQYAAEAFHQPANMQPLLTAAALRRGKATIAALAGVTPVHPQIENMTAVMNILAETQYCQQSQGRTSRVECTVPCDRYGAFYVQTLDGLDQAVGCQDAFTLGQVAYQQYQLLDAAEFAGPDWRVFRSLQRPGHFLVVPARYQITRFEPSEGEKAFRPAILLYSTIDAEDASNSRCVVMATLQPDLPPYVRRDLLDKLQRLHATPQVEYITQVQSDYVINWSLPTAGNGAQLLHLVPQAVKLWDAFQVSFTTDQEGVPQLQAMLMRGAIVAGVQFTLPDGAQLTSELRFDLATIVGPWSTGPVTVSGEGSAVQLANRIERGVNVPEVRVYPPGQPPTTVRVGQHLARDERWPLTLPVAGEVQPVYSVDAGAANLAEIRSYIEDIQLNFVFLNLVNYANHALQELRLRARVRDLPGEQNAVIGERGTAACRFIMPLTTYLATPVLQFQVTKIGVDGSSSQTPWLDWSFGQHGNVVSLTWELIAG